MYNTFCYQQNDFLPLDKHIRFTSLILHYSLKYYKLKIGEITHLVFAFRLFQWTYWLFGEVLWLFHGYDLNAGRFQSCVPRPSSKPGKKRCSQLYVLLGGLIIEAIGEHELLDIPPTSFLNSCCHLPSQRQNSYTGRFHKQGIQL